jgi:hypothetical protein
MRLPPEQPSDDGAEELARRALAVVERRWRSGVLRSRTSGRMPRRLCRDLALDIPIVVTRAARPVVVWLIGVGLALALVVAFLLILYA